MRVVHILRETGTVYPCKWIRLDGIYTVQFAKAICNGNVRYSDILEDSVNEVRKNYANFPDTDVIIKLSKVKYEKRACMGTILFISQEIKLDVIFKN